MESILDAGNLPNQQNNSACGTFIKRQNNIYLEALAILVTMMNFSFLLTLSVVNKTGHQTTFLGMFRKNLSSMMKLEKFNKL